MNSKKKVLEQRQADLRTLVGVMCVVGLCVQSGIHVTVELAERNQAWRLPLCQQLHSKYNMFSAVTKGCAVNLRDVHNHKLVQKGWRILTTCKRLAQDMSLPCRCGKQYRHGSCQGKEQEGPSSYTPEYSMRAARVLQQELTHQSALQECAGICQLIEGFEEGEFCTCGEASGMKVPVACASCLKGRQDVSREQGLEVTQVEESGEDLDEVGLECFGNSVADPTEVHCFEIRQASFLTGFPLAAFEARFVQS